MSENLSVLVTGGAGFIGRAVCFRLLAKGARVVCLDQGGRLGGPAEVCFECDIADWRQLENVFRSGRVDAVIHLASLLPTAARASPQAATSVNILGSANLLEAAVRYGVRRVVYGSSISVYGSNQPEPVSETSPAAPEDIYGAGKGYVELLGERYRQMFGLGFAALRMSTVVGSGAGATSSRWRSEIFEALSSRQPTEVVIPYSPEEKLPLAHVEAVADMLALLAEAEQVSFPVYNTPSETWTFAELKRAVELANESVGVELGTARVSGIPKSVTGDRLIQEFHYTPVSLTECFLMASVSEPFSGQ